MKQFSLLASLFLIWTVNSQSLVQKLDQNTYNDMFWVASGGENPACGFSHFVIKPTKFYVVVDVLNLNSGEEKQIATLYQDLRSAVNMDRESIFNRVKRKVELKNKLALERIGFSNYDSKKLNKILEKINYKEFYDNAKSENGAEFLEDINEFDQKYYAHILFNNGALSGIIARSKQFVVYDKRATTSFKQELIENLIPSGFEPDLKIGDASLLDANHIESYFGEESMHHLTPMGEEGNEYAQVTFLSRDKKEKITLISHPGSADYEFAVFKIEKSTDSDQDLYTSKVGKFVSESGVRLGMNEKDFMEIKGKASVAANKGENIKVYNYCLVDIYNHDLLKEHKMPGYYANYTFDEGILVAFEFGFLNP
jgi:hypothetical protein